MCGTTFELLSSHRGIVCPLAVALRIALGVVVVLEAGLSHKTSSAPPQRRNGRAFSSLTARGGGFPFWVSQATSSPGTNVCVIRSALSDPDRAGQAGHTAASAPAVPPGG